MQTIQYIAVSEGETVACIFNQTRNSGLLYSVSDSLPNPAFL